MYIKNVNVFKKSRKAHMAMLLPYHWIEQETKYKNITLNL